MSSRNHNPATHSREALWQELEELLGKTSKGGLSALTDAEVEDVGKLYRAATTHLALLKTFGASARQRNYLNDLVSRAHALIYGRVRKGRNFRAYLWSFLAFPQAVRASWPYHVAALFFLLLGGFYGYVGSSVDPDWALEVIPAGDTRTPYATRDELRDTLMAGRPSPENVRADSTGKPARDMSSAEKAFFASFLWKHNTTVALLAFFSGFAFGLPTILLVLFNGVILGVYTQTFHSHDLAWEWWAWILPHGVTELLAIILLSGGGLLIGHRMLNPGQLARFEALREIRGPLVHFVCFAFPMFLLAALFESYVRQSGLSESGRYIFAATSAVFWVAFLGFGKVPGAVHQRREEQRTVAERVVPLPVDEELAGGF